MKRFMLFVSAVAAMVLAGSCQQELNPVADGDTTVTFTVNAGDVATRAIADGTNINALHWEIYKTADVQTAAQPLGEKTIIDEDGNKEFTVELKLLADQDYTIIFWAEVNGAGHYNTEDLRNVAINDYSDENANDESRAAFFRVYEFTTENGESINETIELYRPFSQINLGSTTYETSFNNVNGGNVKVETSEMTVTQIATSFNTLTGKGEGEQVVTFKAHATPNAPADDTQKLLEVNDLYYYWLGMNYLIVCGDADNVNVDITLVTNFGDVKHTVNSVPVKENYRTNLLGDFLTTGATFNVVVDADFASDYEYVVMDGATYMAVDSAEDLAKIAANDELWGENIALTGDIDLSELVQTRAASSNWTPIGTSEKPFTGTVNGNGFSIKNLNIVATEAKEGKAYIGFIGYAKGTDKSPVVIKNVTFENVNLNIPCLDIDHSQGHIGAVVGSLEGTCTVENVTVKGDIFVEATVTANGASRVAVVAGGNSYGKVNMRNVHVIANEGSYLNANNNVGAIAGQLQGKTVYENCSSNIDVTGTKFFAGGIVGLAGTNDTFTNCHTTGDITITAGREGRANDQYRVGGIAGGWSDGPKNVCTLTDCSYTGNVSGKNSDGSVAEPLDYAGYVGRGYTLTNCEGSKVIIDGVEYVQVGNSAPYGIYNVNGVLVTNVRNAEELQAALDSEESVNIVFLNDIEGDVTVLQKENINLTVDGKGKKYNGVITVNGNARAAGAETLTFKNINFDAADATEGFTFISAPSKIDNRYNYSHNVTITGCTFTGNYPAVEVGAASFTGTYNLVMKNCTATNMHSALQVQSCDNTALVDGVTVTGCKNGVSFGNTAYPTLKNSTINAAEYGVRADGNASRGNLVVENTIIEAKQGIVVRKTTTPGYAVRLGNDVAIDVTDDYDVVFTKGSDDAAYEKPAVDYSYESVANFNVFPIGVYANNAEELNAWLANADVTNITLAAGEFGTIVAKSGKTIIGTEGAKVDAVNLNGAANLTLKNIAFDAATAIRGYDGKGNAKQYANIVTGDAANKPNKGAWNLVIDGCTFAGTFANGGASIAFTDQGRGSGASGNVTIKNCTFNTVGAYYDIYGHYTGNGSNGYGDFAIENNTFKTSFPQGRPVYLGRYASSTPVVVKGNAFKTVATLEDAVYVQAHSGSYSVSIDASDNTFAN